MFESHKIQGDQQTELITLFERQHSICSQYLRIARQEFFSKEAELISQANDLLEKVSSKEAVKDLSEWDVFSTRDTMVLDEESFNNLTTLSA